ncbi:hypothetical protein HK405_010206, partial [Cladochytrium tenue]
DPPGGGGLLGCLADMRAAGARPNAVTYLVLLDHYADALVDGSGEASRVDADKGLNAVLEVMDRDRVPTTERHWTVLMRAAWRRGDFSRVDQIWDLLKRGPPPATADADADGAAADSDAPLPYATEQPSLRRWRVPEAAASVYLDTLGFRRDLDRLEAEFAWLARMPPRRDAGSATASSTAPVAAAAPSVLTENACNSYVQALIACGRPAAAVAFVTDQMGRRGSPTERCIPSAKTLRTVVLGLLHRPDAAAVDADGAADLTRGFCRWARAALPGQWAVAMGNPAFADA